LEVLFRHRDHGSG